MAVPPAVKHCCVAICMKHAECRACTQALRSELLQLKACMEAMQQRLEFMEQQFGGGSISPGSGANDDKPSHAKFMGLF